MGELQGLRRDRKQKLTNTVIDTLNFKPTLTAGAVHSVFTHFVFYKINVKLLFSVISSLHSMCSNTKVCFYVVTHKEEQGESLTQRSLFELVEIIS